MLLSVGRENAHELRHTLIIHAFMARLVYMFIPCAVNGDNECLYTCAGLAVQIFGLRLEQTCAWLKRYVLLARYLY